MGVRSVLERCNRNESMDACEQPSEDESVTRKLKMIGSKEALQMKAKET